MRTTRAIGGLSALALVFASFPANADILKNFQTSGQIDVQATSAENVTDFTTNKNDHIGDAQTRLMVRTDWDLLDDVHARVSFVKNDINWGANASAGDENSTNLNGASNVAPGSQQISQTVDTGSHDILGSLAVDEAYFKVDKVAGQVDMTFGRQFYGDPGDAVIFFGPSDKAWYGLPVTAIDAARLDWMPADWFAATGLVGKISGTQITYPTLTVNTDTDLQGLNMKAHFNDNLGMGLYGWNRVIHASGAPGVPPDPAASPATGLNDNLFLVGYKLKLAGAGFWLNGEYDQNFGDNRLQAAPSAPTQDYALASHYNGWATLADAGWKAESDNAGMLSIWGNFAMGSGRQNTKSNVNDGFQPINPDYQAGSIYGRFAANPGFAGLGSTAQTNAGTTAGNTSFTASPSIDNRIIWGGGIKMSPAVANKATLGVSFWNYHIQRFDDLPGQANYIYAGNRNIGSELDVDLTWAHSDNVAFATGWGTFQPGGLIAEALKEGGSPVPELDPVSLVYFDTRVKF